MMAVFHSNWIGNTVWLLLLLGGGFYACAPVAEKQAELPAEPYLLVLGIAQDAGYPQAACQKECCQAVWSGRNERRYTSCLALVDPRTSQAWLIDATPDFREQLHVLTEVTGANLAGIFLTHAHIGHYTGLMHLGREAMGAKDVPVYAMPRLSRFLQDNGPWSQLVELNNIELRRLRADSTITLLEDLRLTPVPVPHRDEFSETVGFLIQGPSKRALYIPDIDKWLYWDRDIRQYIWENDYALLDGTFYSGDELPGRNMNEIPHPFVSESLKYFDDMFKEHKEKIFFIHLNHTNPLLQPQSEARRRVEQEHMQVASEGDVLAL